MRLARSTVSLTAAVLLAACGALGTQPTGDPGDRVLTQLRSAVTATVPTGAQVKSFKSYPTHFHSKCPDNPSGQNGWDAVRVQVLFSTQQPEMSIASTINSILLSQGWVRHDVESEVYIYGDNHSVQQKIPQWTKTAPSGSNLTLSLYPENSGPQDLALEGRWDPPGFSLPGC